MPRPINTEWFYRQRNLKHLTPATRCLLLYLVEETSNGQRILNKTYPEIAEEIELSYSTIKKGFNSLAKLTMIEILPRNGRAHRIKLVAPRNFSKILSKYKNVNKA